jgi:NADH dehydrogenase
MKVVMPDVAQLLTMTPTAQHAIRQGKVVVHNVAGRLGYGK